MPHGRRRSRASDHDLTCRSGRRAGYGGAAGGDGPLLWGSRRTAVRRTGPANGSGRSTKRSSPAPLPQVPCSRGTAPAGPHRDLRGPTSTAGETLILCQPSQWRRASAVCVPSALSDWAAGPVLRTGQPHWPGWHSRRWRGNGPSWMATAEMSGAGHGESGRPAACCAVGWHCGGYLGYVGVDGLLAGRGGDRYPVMAVVDEMLVAYAVHLDRRDRGAAPLCQRQLLPAGPHPVGRGPEVPVEVAP